ncbi:MAG: restriction endonuclease subunit S [Muribaculum sp.]|nr:restriction endonuclease subunit S [Muribaculum sp.]
MIVKFGEVAERLNIKVDQKNTDLEVYVGGEHIESQELLVHNNAPIKGSTIGYQFQFGFEANDILFMTKNPHLRKASLVKFRGLCSIATFVIRTKNPEILLQDYLAIEMQSNRFWNYCEEHKSGGVNYFINWGTLSQYEFDLPNIAIQKELSKKVWAAYRLKEAYKRLLTATDEMVKSQFLEMFGNHPHFKYSSKPLGEIAFEWLKGQPFKKDSLTNNGSNEAIHYGQLFTTYGPVIDEVVSMTEIEAKIISNNGDILFPASDVTPNGLARCSAILRDNVILGGDIICLRPQKDYNPIYLSYAINMQKSQMLIRVTGAVVKHMSAKSLKTVKIPIPPAELQEQFAAIAQQADKSKFELRKAIDAIDEVIKSLING